MDLYGIKISSAGNGWSDSKTAQGRLEEVDGALTISYSIDGDDCILSVKNNVVTQERRGAQFVKITFEKGKRTQCVIGSGGFTGSYEVFTRKLEFISGRRGCKLSLEYTNGSDEELVKLTFTTLKITP